MSDATATEPEAPKKKSGKPLILGLTLMVALGGAGFYGTWAGLIPGLGHGQETPAETTAADPLPEVAYVPIEPIVISLGGEATGRHLRFTAQMEVVKGAETEVAHLLPRVVDMANDYLRAVTPSDFDDQDILIRLRAQLLRRIKLVTGEGRVRDLLVTEFILN